MRAATSSLLLALPFQAAMAVEFTPLIELLERGQVTLQPKGQRPPEADDPLGPRWRESSDSGTMRSSQRVSRAI